MPSAERTGTRWPRDDAATASEEAANTDMVSGWLQEFVTRLDLSGVPGARHPPLPAPWGGLQGTACSQGHRAPRHMKASPLPPHRGHSGKLRGGRGWDFGVFFTTGHSRTRPPPSMLLVWWSARARAWHHRGLAAPGPGHGSVSEECVKPLGNEKDHLSHQKTP